MSSVRRRGRETIASYSSKHEGDWSWEPTWPNGVHDVDSTDGTARVLNDSFNALEVEFPGGPPQQGANYLIEAVGPVEGDQYSWAAVRSPDDDLGWILARTPELDQQARQEAEQALDQSGIDPERFQATEQPPQYYDPRQ